MNGKTPEGHENLGGMTLNERLFVTGLRADFDKAIYADDEEAAVALLGRVRMDEGAARASVAAILSNPRRYGYLRVNPE